MKTVTINNYHIFSDSLKNICVKNKCVINTLNAHSFIVAKKDKKFEKALMESDILLPDGEGIVFMANLLTKKNITKIAGADLHNFFIKEANAKALKCFYLGSSEETLKKLKSNLEIKHKNISFKYLSPPFKESFSEKDNVKILKQINEFSPDILFVGMTAPKQEKWVFENKKKINANIICSIGAVFDFIAKTKKRAPQWVINLKLEWLYRSLTSRRLAKRYFYSTPRFLLELLKLKFSPKNP